LEINIHHISPKRNKSLSNYGLKKMIQAFNWFQHRNADIKTVQIISITSIVNKKGTIYRESSPFIPNISNACDLVIL
jgi:hypothetical protein